MNVRDFGGLALFALLTLMASGAEGSISRHAAVETGVKLKYIVVAPEPVPTLPLGGSQQFVATGCYSDGSTQDLSSTVTWKSSSTTTATISTTGIATAVAVGTTNITASIRRIASLPVTLSTMNATLVSLKLSSTNLAAVAVGRSTQFTAHGTYSNGFTQDITPAVAWASTHPAVADLQTYLTAAPGLATGRKPGMTSIYAIDPLTGKTSPKFKLTVPNTYAVGGTTRLRRAGTSITLLDTVVTFGTNTTDTVTINSNGHFSFPSALAPGATYHVKVSSAILLGGAHPCTVVDGNGTINATKPSPVRDLQLVCAPAVGTFAGSATGQTGNAMGVGESARFNSPRGLAINTLTGEVYVTDDVNNIIQAISPSGVVHTLAGTGTAGYNDNTTGNAATFSSPEGLAFDPNQGTAGTLYVVDSDNQVIRKIDIATNMVSTFAGSGASGNSDGQGTAASFNYPTQLATDSAGNIYVADTYNNSIRKITSGGLVSTLAGAGTFYNPEGVAVNPATGVVYVADTNNQVIKAISGTKVSTLAGRKLRSGFADGRGTHALFYNPAYLAIDSKGNIYVADNRNGALRKVSPPGVVTTLAGNGVAISPEDGPTSVATLARPWGLAADATGDVYTTEFAPANLRKYTP